MLLKARIKNPELMSQLAASLEGLGETWVLRFTPEKMHVIIAGPQADGAARVWGQIQAEAAFHGYRVRSAHGDEVWLEMQGSHFGRAARSCAAGTVLKLAKNAAGQAVLSFQIGSVGGAGARQAALTQDVPVAPLSPEQTALLGEPHIPLQDVSILLPADLRALKAVADKLRALDSELTVAANMSGELQLRVETASARVVRTIRQLTNPEFDADDDDRQPSLPRHPHLFSAVSVDGRAFGRFLQSQALHPSNVVCCIVEGYGLVLYVYIGDGDLTAAHYGAFVYYLPSHSRDA